MAMLAVSAIALLFYGLPSGFSTEKHAPEAQAPVPADVVEIQMRNVNFRLAKDIALEVGALRGKLRRTRPDVPVTFDDSASFTVEIDSAKVAITPESLTALMNSYVLAYAGAPLKQARLTTDGNRLIMKGTIRKGITLPFEIESSLSTTEDGNIRAHADKIKAGHIQVKRLLHLFGEDLSKLVNQNAGRGMKIVGDDIILTPSTMTPPPHLEGRVTRVDIAGGKIVQFFDSGRHLTPLTPPFDSTAYIYHRGGTLRFGKLTMNDADLEIVGDGSGLFDFFQREYRKQLIAGYSRNTPANGLIAHMVDYSHLRDNTTPLTPHRKPAAPASGRH
jgi:hypothetical protein